MGISDVCLLRSSSDTGIAAKRLYLWVWGNLRVFILCHWSRFPRGLQKTHRAVRSTKVSTYSEGYRRPPRLLSCNHPAAVSPTYRSSGWERARAWSFRGVLARPLLAGWVALLPKPHLQAKYFHLLPVVLVLEKRMFRNQTKMTVV